MLAGGGPVAIADHQLVAVFDVLDGVVLGLAVCANGVERRIVLWVAGVPLRGRVLVPTAVEADRKFALRIVLPKKNLRDGRAAFLAGIPGVEQYGHFIEPAAGVH